MPDKDFWLLTCHEVLAILKTGIPDIFQTVNRGWYTLCGKFWAVYQFAR